MPKIGRAPVVFFDHQVCFMLYNKSSGFKHISNTCISQLVAFLKAGNFCFKIYLVFLWPRPSCVTAYRFVYYNSSSCYCYLNCSNVAVGQAICQSANIVQTVIQLALLLFAFCQYKLMNCSAYFAACRVDIYY